MGWIPPEDIYKKLAKKIDTLSMRAPYNETFYKILMELCSTEEADILIKMPFKFSTLDELVKVTKCEKSRLRKVLDDLCKKAFVFDMHLKEVYYYRPAPVYIGIFDIVMMSTRENLNIERLSKLFYDYLHEYFGDNSFYASNFAKGEKVSFARTIPHEETVKPKDGVEILDYEKATAIIKQADKFAIGLCSCRREKEMIKKKPCNFPLETCSSIGPGAHYMIRHGFSKEISKSEMLDNLSKFKELGLVSNVDNVQKDIFFMCYCCKCCCNLLNGINKYGYPNTIVSSTYIAEIDESKCESYDRCYEVCPVDCIERFPVGDLTSKQKTKPKIDEPRCIGCGICVAKCPAGAIKMVERKQRIIRPATLYERLILQSLERGTLEYQLFDNPQNMTQKALRVLIGGFLRLPPVKKALMSDMLRSTFLRSLKRFKFKDVIF